MRTSPIRELLAERGAVFGERAGAEIALAFGDVADEYRTVRSAVGLADFSFVTRHRVPEDGLDALERYAAGAVASIRFGRVLHTFAADDAGLLESDLYVANDDENLLVLGESLVDDGATAAALEKVGAFEAGAEDLAESTAVLGLDGVNAWAVAQELFGSDVLGLPYLSVETYELAGEEVKLLRAGKTSEFGYLLIVPAARAADAWREIERAGEPHGLAPVGAEAHSVLRLDGRFFNIHEEGARVRDPLPLGLQWMIDLEGDDFVGRGPILERRAAGVDRKIIGVLADEPDLELAPGDALACGGDAVAEVVTAAHSPTLERWIALALFDRAYAYSGLPIERGGRPARTISLPPFTAASLSVKLDEM